MSYQRVPQAVADLHPGIYAAECALDSLAVAISDPTTRLAALPRDITQYCIRPYFKSPAMNYEDICGAMSDIYKHFEQAFAPVEINNTTNIGTGLLHAMGLNVNPGDMLEIKYIPDGIVIMLGDTMHYYTRDLRPTATTVLMRGLISYGGGCTFVAHTMTFGGQLVNYSYSPGGAAQVMGNGIHLHPLPCGLSLAIDINNQCSVTDVPSSARSWNGLASVVCSNVEVCYDDYIEYHPYPAIPKECSRTNLTPYTRTMLTIFAV